MSKEFFSTGNSHNVIAAGTTIKGDIATDADFRLDGEIAGNIVCKGKIVIGSKAVVEGNIDAGSAEILGKVHGHVRVKELLSIKATAHIDGDVEMQTLSVEPPAFLSGNCYMITHPAGNKDHA